MKNWLCAIPGEINPLHASRANPSPTRLAASSSSSLTAPTTTLAPPKDCIEKSPVVVKMVIHGNYITESIVV